MSFRDVAVGHTETIGAQRGTYVEEQFAEVSAASCELRERGSGEPSLHEIAAIQANSRADPTRGFLALP